MDDNTVERQNLIARAEGEIASTDDQREEYFFGQRWIPESRAVDAILAFTATPRPAGIEQHFITTERAEYIGGAEMRIEEHANLTGSSGYVLGGERVEDVREAAWRDGWACCKACLTEDEAFCLTEDVEADAWADSTTATAIRSANSEVTK